MIQSTKNLLRKVRRNAPKRQRSLNPKTTGIDGQPVNLNAPMYGTIQRAFVRGPIECKYTSFALISSGFQTISNTTVVNVVTSGIIGGDDFTNRNGRQILVRQVRLSGLLVGGQSNVITDDAYNQVRIVVYTMGSNNALTFDLTASLDPRVQQNLKHVYLDKLITLHSPARDSVGYLPAIREVNFKVSMQFNQDYVSLAVNATTGDYLAIAMVSDSTAVPHPGFVSGMIDVIFDDQ
jgi:hypothetical protein